MRNSYPTRSANIEVCCTNSYVNKPTTFQGLNKLSKGITSIIIVMFFLFSTDNMFSQIIIESGGVEADFGTDADVQVNITEYIYNSMGVLQPNNANPGTDDWFDNNDGGVGGNGEGVIDQTAPLPNTIGNTSFTRGMSVAPFTTIDGNIWIDAAYIRDPNWAGNNVDFSIFKGGSNKNADNPLSWSIITGSNPQKNDLIDGFAHLRRDGANMSDPLWSFIGASTRSSDGSSYIDVEYYQSDVQFDPMTNVLSNTGPDGGHTDWDFFIDGTVSDVGDAIVSLNFEGGGTDIIGHIYIWVKPSDLPGGSIIAYNALIDMGAGSYNFRFVIGGNGQPVFESGDMADGFGYAEIELFIPSLDTVAFASINADDVVTGPWGTKFGPQATQMMVHPELSLIEMGINLSEFGLDQQSGGGGVCNALFGGVMVKTRSSASFTSELKDLLGPFTLGADPDPLVVECPDNITIDCNGVVQNSVDDLFDSSINKLTTAFDDWLLGFSVSGGGGTIIETYTVNGGPPIDFALFPQGITEPSNFCAGDSVTVVLNASDQCEQMDSCSSTFTILPDNEDPTASNPDPLTVECLANVPASDIEVVDDEADNCGTPTVTHVGDVSDNDPCEPVITRTYRVTDTCGNFIDVTQTITIDYTQGVTAPPDEMDTVECPDDATDPGAPADVLDACGRTVSAVLVGSSSDPDPVTCEGTVVWTYRYTDCTGQGTDDWTFTYTIDYTQGVTAPPDEMDTVECPDDATDPGAPADVLDACGRTVSAVLVGSSSDPDPVTCEGTVVWTYRYTDCTGQGTDDWTFTYTIDLTTPPNAGADDGSMVQCIDDAVEPIPPAGILDACGRPIIPTGPIVNTDFDGCQGTRTYTWTYTDCAQNNDDWVFTYEIEDTIDPEIINLPVVDLLCDEPFPTILFADWIDNCADGGQISATPTNIMTNACGETADYVFTATDDCGNTDTETVTVEREFDLIENCETAFGRLEGSEQCFLTDPDYTFHRWGWTNYIAEEGVYTMELYAGAAHCDITRGDHVGQVIVTYDNGLVDVEYQLFEGFVMSEAHINIGCEKYPRKPNGQVTVAPGQYNFNLGTLDFVTNYTLEDVEVDGPFWIIAHAVTCEETCRCSISGDEGGTQTTNESIDCTGDNIVWDPSLDFDVSPVPFDGEFTVDYTFEYDTDVTIEVYDIKGILVRNITNSDYVKGTNAKTKIEMREISDEILFVKLKTNRGSGVKKIVSMIYKNRN